MNYTFVECEQLSPEWFAARAGRLTGSRAADMLAKIKSGEAAARRDLRLQLACERLTGKPMEIDFVTKDMQRGTDLEPVALGEYEVATGNVVERTGFISCTDVMAGCSLDGHIGNLEGIVEFKCPKSATHLRYIRDNRVPPEYVPQITHNLWVSGAEWADFMSFDDRFPQELQLFIARAYRKDIDFIAYEAEVARFLAEVNLETKELQQLRIAA